MAGHDQAPAPQNLAQVSPWATDPDEALRNAALARGYAPDLTDREREDILDLIENEQHPSTLDKPDPAMGEQKADR